MLGRLIFAICIALASIGCGSSDSKPDDEPLTDDQYREKIVGEMHTLMLEDIELLLKSSGDIRDAVPTPAGRGWDATTDAAAIDSAKTSWTNARSAYERIEGAIAPLFPDTDYAIDARYDDFLADLAATGGDPNPFDGKGVTGMHAVERILWANETPARVIELEKTLPNYWAQAFPATEAEATEFKSGLCEQLVTDVATLRDAWQPAEIHIAITFQGLVSLMNEQREKVAKAASNEEESRYAQRTMVDIRDNLAGTKKAYALFKPWIRSKQDGPAIDEKIEAGFDDLDEAYQAVPGDSFPVPPDTWSSENPTPADLATPFGVLYANVSAAVDANQPDSVVAQMNLAAKALGFTVFGK